MTKRKEDMIRVAEALGLEARPGETTSELAARCEERAAELVELVSNLREDTETAPDPGVSEAPEHEAPRRPRKAKARRRSAEVAS